MGAPCVDREVCVMGLITVAAIRTGKDKTEHTGR
jgi:hypothetical protein